MRPHARFLHLFRRDEVRQLNTAYRCQLRTNGNHRTVTARATARRRSPGGRREVIGCTCCQGWPAADPPPAKRSVCWPVLPSRFSCSSPPRSLPARSTAAAVAATVQQYQEINGSLPNAAQVSATSSRRPAFSIATGSLLQEIADQDYGWRTFVPFEKISPHLIDATIAAEDATFWSHEGVEPYAIARGAITSPVGRGHPAARPSPSNSSARSIPRLLAPRYRSSANGVRVWRPLRWNVNSRSTIS